MSTRLLELAAALILLVCVLDGVHKGLLLKVFYLVRMIVVLALTMVLVPIFKPVFAGNLQTQNGVAYIAALIVAAIAVAIVVRVLKLVDHIPVLNTVNRLGGAIFGACIGIVFIWIALALLGAFQDVSWCKEATECARQSEILRIIQKFDPMSYLLKQIDFPMIF